MQTKGNQIQRPYDNKAIKGGRTLNVIYQHVISATRGLIIKETKQRHAESSLGPWESSTSLSELKQRTFLLSAPFFFVNTMLATQLPLADWMLSKATYNASVPPPSAGFFFLCSVIPVVPPLLGGQRPGKTMPLPVLVGQWPTRFLCAVIGPFIFLEAEWQSESKLIINKSTQGWFDFSSAVYFWMISRGKLRKLSIACLKNHHR